RPILRRVFASRRRADSSISSGVSFTRALVRRRPTMNRRSGDFPTTTHGPADLGHLPASARDCFRHRADAPRGIVWHASDVVDEHDRPAPSGGQPHLVLLLRTPPP